MKTLPFLLIPLILISCLESNPENEVLEYNRFLNESINPVVKKMADFEDAVYEGDEQRLIIIRNEMKDFVLVLKEKIEAKKAYDGNEEYKEAAIEILNFYDAISEKHYLNIIRLMETTQHRQSFDTIENILTDLYRKEHVLYKNFERRSKEYKDKYGIQSFTDSKK
jgi:hypothetical protein